jgi:hypothetical protein
VSVPRFIDRVVDATAPVLGGLDRESVRARLDEVSVTLVGGERAAAGHAREGFLLAANLVARLYPRIRLAGPDELVRAATREIVLINPGADVGADDTQSAATVAYEAEADRDGVIAIRARGWNVYVDDEASRDDEPTAPAALAAAALGVAELFRTVFADDLDVRGRTSRQPGAFNIVTLGEPRFDLAAADRYDIGTVRLVGVGAIGQATAKTLAAAGAQGSIVAIDDEKIALSNLQRYVLTQDSDVGSVKVGLLHDRLAPTGLAVEQVTSEWHVGLAEQQLPTLVALDSPEARVGVQASLPGPIYNAWTQPADVGWSRHEQFGQEPCLACMYIPQHETPSRHEQVASAFQQDPLRVLAYLVHRLPIGLPLPPGGIPVVPGLEAPPEAGRWLKTPIADDIATAAGIESSELASWRERPIADVYQDGICGGALLHLNVGEAPREALVPLAHQSALAGVMLATELLVAQAPELRAVRPAVIEGRYDVLAGLPQVLARPRARADGCLCGDVVWRAVYGDKLGVEAPQQASAEVEGGVDGRIGRS